MRDRQQPPLDEHESPRQLVGILDGEPRRVGGIVGERERRIAVGAEASGEGVERDPPGPPQHPDVEVEQGPRIAAGEEHRHPGDEGEHEEGHPQEQQHDAVRDRQEPLHQPLPPRQLGVEQTIEQHGLSFRDLVATDSTGDHRLGIGSRRTGWWLLVGWRVP